MIKLKNKMDKRGEKLISVYWFAILFIVAAAIVYMTALFYGDPYDVRKLEADILTDQIADCFSKRGYFNEEINDENFLQKCNLNFDIGDVLGSGEGGLYYVEINVFNFGEENSFLRIEEGNVNLNLNCGLEGKTQPHCLERSFYSIDTEGNQYQINILSVVGKGE